MNRNSTFHVRLAKVVASGHRNIDAYYVVLRDNRQSTQYISRTMRVDQDSSDELRGEVEIRPSCLEIWNYDKMKLTASYSVDFRINPLFACTIYEDNMELRVERHNPWEEEMKNRRNEQDRIIQETLLPVQTMSVAQTVANSQPRNSTPKHTATKQPQSATNPRSLNSTPVKSPLRPFSPHP